MYKLSNIIKAVLTLPKEKSSNLQKLQVQQLEGKNGHYLQFSLQKGTQVFHENYSMKEGIQKLEELLPLFRQAEIDQEGESLHLLANRRGEFTVTRKKSSSSVQSHNRTKQHPFPEGVAHPFLQALGVQDKEGKIPYSQRDKFTQINHFITLAAPLLNELPSPKIIDLGCGKGYLTLALHAFLQGKGEIIGVDRKTDVMEKLNGIVKTLGWKNISFIAGDIATYPPTFQPDLVVALHACNTATDMAIEKGIEWKAKGLLIAPCCQQELLPILKKEDWEPLLKWGAIAERFAALLTDACRGEILTALGYKTDIIEFVDASHTPKNLLIRAIKQHPLNEEAIIKLKGSSTNFHLLDYLRNNF